MMVSGWFSPTAKAANGSYFYKDINNLSVEVTSLSDDRSNSGFSAQYPDIFYVVEVDEFSCLSGSAPFYSTFGGIPGKASSGKAVTAYGLGFLNIGSSITAIMDDIGKIGEVKIALPELDFGKFKVTEKYKPHPQTPEHMTYYLLESRLGYRKWVYGYDISNQGAAEAYYDADTHFCPIPDEEV